MTKKLVYTYSRQLVSLLSYISYEISIKMISIESLPQSQLQSFSNSFILVALTIRPRRIKIHNQVLAIRVPGQAFKKAVPLKPKRYKTGKR